MKLELQIDSTEGRRTASAEGPIVRLGRDPECEASFDAAKFPKVSGLHAQFESSGGGLIVRPLSRSNATLLNDRPIDGPVSVKKGDVVRLGHTGPSIRILQIALKVEPAVPEPLPTQPPAAPITPTVKWSAVGVGCLLVVAAAFAMIPRGPKPAEADANPVKPPEPVVAEAPKAPPPIVNAADRFANAVVAVGNDVDGVFRIQGTGLLVTPEHVFTTAMLADHVRQIVKEAQGGKPASLAIRHPGGMMRLRRLTNDPKFDADRQESTLSHNLAIGLLDRPLTELAVWPSAREAIAAMARHKNSWSGSVDVVAWDGQGNEFVKCVRRNWPGLAIHGTDDGANGEVLACRLEEQFPGSAAGGPAFKDGEWCGLLFRHPSLVDPSKRVWKFVPTTYVVGLLNQEGD